MQDTVVEQYLTKVGFLRNDYNNVSAVFANMPHTCLKRVSLAGNQAEVRGNPGPAMSQTRGDIPKINVVQ